MIWILLAVAATGIVWLIDFIVRRKTWNQNTQAEKGSLVMTFMFSFPYIFTSVAGTLLGKLDLGEKALSPIVVAAGYATPAVVIAGVLESIILRKQGKVAEANLAQIFAFGYCCVVIIAALFF